MGLVNMNNKDDRKYGWNMTKKCSQRPTLFFEFDRNSWHRQTLTLPQKIFWCGWLGQFPQPRLASSHCPASLCSSTRNKTSGMEVRRIPDKRLILRFVVVNFGPIQLFSVKFIRSSWFGQVNNPRFVFCWSNCAIK